MVNWKVSGTFSANTNIFSLYICIRHTNAYTHSRREEEVSAKEVGDEWALSKQHLKQEVPIGRLRERKHVHGCRSVGGVDVTPADFETTTQRRGPQFCPVSISQAAYVLYRVQGKHLVSFSSTNFVQLKKNEKSTQFPSLIKALNWSNLKMLIQT